MPIEQIVRGQPVNQDLLTLAKQLRHNMTPAERIIWQELRAGRPDGHQFRRQQIIDSAIVDFYYHRSRLVIEIDGPIHQTQPEADALRDERLQARGLTVLRFTNDEALDEELVMDKIDETAKFLARGRVPRSRTSRK